MNSEYIFLFLAGGLFSIITKYLTNNLSPKIGAIVATVPISLFSAYFIVHEEKIPHFMSEYLEQTLFIMVMTLIYIYLLKQNFLKHKTIYALIITMWMLFAATKIIL